MKTAAAYFSLAAAVLYFGFAFWRHPVDPQVEPAPAPAVDAQPPTLTPKPVAALPQPSPVALPATVPTSVPEEQPDESSDSSSAAKAREPLAAAPSYRPSTGRDPTKDLVKNLRKWGIEVDDTDEALIRKLDQATSEAKGRLRVATKEQQKREATLAAAMEAEGRFVVVPAGQGLERSQDPNLQGQAHATVYIGQEDGTSHLFTFVGAEHDALTREWKQETGAIAELLIIDALDAIAAVREAQGK